MNKYHIQPKDTLKLQLPFFECVCVCVCMYWPLRWNQLLKHKVVPMIMLYSPFLCCCINTSHQCGKLKFNFVSLLYVSDIPLQFKLEKIFLLRRFLLTFLPRMVPVPCSLQMHFNIKYFIGWY